MLRLNEHFSSIQGEGTLSGRPTYFIRFDGCNISRISCPWCDQPSALEDRPAHRPPTEYDEEEIGQIVSAYPLSVDVCFTGGEPTAQWNELNELVDIIRANDGGTERRLTMESNGTIYVQKFAYGANTFLSCSPKFNLVSVDGMSQAHGQRAISDWIASGVDMQLKFVVTDGEKHFRAILKWVEKVLPAADQRRRIPLIFQPEFFKGREAFQSLLKTLSHVEEWKKVADLGFSEVRFLPQAHKIFAVR